MCLESLKIKVKNIYEDEKKKGNNLIDITLGWQVGQDFFNRVQIEFKFNKGKLSDEIKYYEYKSGARCEVNKQEIINSVNENYQVDIMHSIDCDE